MSRTTRRSCGQVTGPTSLSTPTPHQHQPVLSICLSRLDESYSPLRLIIRLLVFCWLSMPQTHTLLSVIITGSLRVPRLLPSPPRRPALLLFLVVVPRHLAAWTRVRNGGEAHQRRGRERFELARIPSRYGIPRTCRRRRTLCLPLQI